MQHKGKPSLPLSVLAKDHMSPSVTQDQFFASTFFPLRIVGGRPRGCFAAWTISAPPHDGACAFRAQDLGSVARIHDDHAPPHDRL